MFTVLPVLEAEARPRTSSGGYSRPSSGGYSRTPSFRPSAPPVRTPSSGGYSRPGGSGFPSSGATYGRSPSVTSGSDRAFNREASGDALRRVRERDAALRRQAETPAPTSGSAGASRSGGGGWGGSWGGNWNTGQIGGRTAGGPDWYRQRGWNPPGSVLGGARGFGVWDAAFLWFMLSTLNRPGHGDFFHNHANDPGFGAWRSQVQEMARTDPAVQQQLDQLDRELASRAAQPRDPNYLPPDVPPDVAVADRAGATEAAAPAAGDASPGLVGGVVVIGGGLLGLLALRRMRRNSSGTGTMRTGTAGTLASASEMLRHKVSGEGYAPERFRVGMGVTLDPTPFLLLGGAGKATLPGAAGADRVSVSALGRVADGTGGGAARLVRLYLPGDAMLQVHPGAGGGDGASSVPAECRYFSRLDEVNPADEAEWDAWLHPTEGMIGWPEFQTQDGKTYARVWSPGGSKVEPRMLLEQIDDGTGTLREVRHEAMLYAAPTGAAEPAPATEYVLVQTTEDGGRAWVEVWSGIDLNPASLGLNG
jgi:hypothetical protein